MLAIYIYISLLYYVPTRWGQLVLEGGNARLLILRAWTTVPRPLLLGYTFQSLTRYKGDRFRSWLRPSVPISKGLYTHRGNRPISLPTITGLAWSEGWFGRVDSDPDPQSFLPSEYEQSEWDWYGLVRRGGLIIHTLRIENSSGRL